MFYFCVLSMIIWAVSAILWLVSAVMHLNLIHFFLFIGSDIIFSIFFLLALCYGEKQCVIVISINGVDQ